MRTMVRWLQLLTLLLAAWLALPTAHAQGVSQARGSEEEARQAFEAGEFERAALAFAEAFAAAPRAATKYNEAFSWQKAGKIAPAADGYESALGMEDLGDKLTDASRDRLGELKKQLGYVQVVAPVGGSVSVAHAVEVPIPARIHLLPGHYQLEVQSGGSTSQHALDVIAGRSLRIDATSEPQTAKLPAPPLKQPAADDDAESGMGQWVAGWVGVGLGAATLVAAGVVGGMTLSAVSDYDASGNTDAKLRDDAVTLRTTTNVLLGVGAGIAAIGVVLLLTTPTEEPAKESVSVALRIGAGSVHSAVPGPAPGLGVHLRW